MPGDDDLRQVLLDQREELKAPPPAGKWVPRSRERELRDALRRPLIKVITGVRRSGKSVLARLALAGRDFAYVNFDDERLAGLRTEDLQRVEKAVAALRPSTRLWLLDEVQNVEGWELFVNRLHRLGWNLVVTGSNSKLLSRELATHLTGRYVPIEVFPFSFREFLAARDAPVPSAAPTTRERAGIEERLREYALVGGFPEMVVSGPSGGYLRELHDKIVSRDIAARYRVKHPRTLKELSLYCFSNPGAPMTYNRVQRAFDFRSVHTAESYVGFLEEAYLILPARPFAFKFREQIRQARKVYTIDNAMTLALSTKATQDRGALLENLVFQELRRRDLDVFTWTQPDHAVDFLIREDRRVAQLVQVCAAFDSPETVAREYRALHKAAKIARCKDLLLLTPDGAAPPARFVPRGPKVRVEPLWRWLLGLR
ncbi:MAG: ATP-binding protein [Planctomycetes bacterium]|nr:ATP-binding protein [Planctomycetota bacterium]